MLRSLLGRASRRGFIVSVAEVGLLNGGIPMAIGKPRGKNGSRPIFVHVPKDADPAFLKSLGLNDTENGAQVERAPHRTWRLGFVAAIRRAR